MTRFTYDQLVRHLPSDQLGRVRRERDSDLYSFTPLHGRYIHNVPANELQRLPALKSEPARWDDADPSIR